MKGQHEHSHGEGDTGKITSKSYSKRTLAKSPAKFLRGHTVVKYHRSHIHCRTVLANLQQRLGRGGTQEGGTAGRVSRAGGVCGGREREWRWVGDRGGLLWRSGCG